MARQRPFRLADEAAPVVEIIDRLDGPVHLVGHSYGGAVALRAAFARSSRVASLSLYEPMVPHVLKLVGPEGMAAWQDLRTLFRDIDDAVLEGTYRRAARRFCDYFNGSGRWNSMNPDAQTSVMRYIPKLCLESRAILGDRIPFAAYAGLRIPMLLMHGGSTIEPTALITRKLAEIMKATSWQVLDGANHMAPITRPDEVNAYICDHIVKAGGPSIDAHVAAPSLPDAAA